MILPSVTLTYVLSSQAIYRGTRMHMVLKANRILGLLKRRCPLITDVKVRRTLYLSLAKSQLSLMPQRCGLPKCQIERRATRRILRTKICEVSYKQRLLTLLLLPLSYDREIRDLVFLFNCISGSTNLPIDRLVTFVSHDRSRSQNPALMLKPAFCKPLLFRPLFLIGL